jgi:hypothetical protein
MSLKKERATMGLLFRALNSHGLPNYTLAEREEQDNILKVITLWCLGSHDMRCLRTSFGEERIPRDFMVLFVWDASKYPGYADAEE